MCCKLSGADPSAPVPVRENPAVKAGLFACTGNGTIIEPILTIFGKCICLVVRQIYDYLKEPPLRFFEHTRNRPV